MTSQDLVHHEAVLPIVETNGTTAIEITPELLDKVIKKIWQQLDEPLVEDAIDSLPAEAGGFDYVKGHVIIRTANRLFRWGWEHQLVGPITEKTFVRSANPTTGEILASTTMYWARVRVRMLIPGFGSHEDEGCGITADDTPQAHRTARKGAITDGVKRCLAYYGAAFGLELRDGSAPNRHRSGSQRTGRPRAAIDTHFDTLAKQAGRDAAKLRESLANEVGVSEYRFVKSEVVEERIRRIQSKLDGAKPASAPAAPAQEAPAELLPPPPTDPAHSAELAQQPLPDTEASASPASFETIGDFLNHAMQHGYYGAELLDLAHRVVPETAEITLAKELKPYMNDPRLIAATSTEKEIAVAETE